MKFRFALFALLAAIVADAQIIPTPIGNLPQISTLSGTEIYPLQQANGSPASVSSSNIATYVLAQLSQLSVVSLWTGTCSSTTFLRGDGQCVAAGSGSGIGNVVTTGTPASGNLVMFSGATSITQGDLSGDCTTAGTLAITCTKTSGTNFGTLATANATTPPALGGTTPAAGSFTNLTASSSTPGGQAALTITGAANSYSLFSVGSSTSGQSYGAYIAAGTGSSDFTLRLRNAAQSVDFLDMSGNGATTVTAPWAFNPSTANAGIMVNANASATGITVDGSSGNYSEYIQGASSSGNSFGLNIFAGYTGADAALYLANHNNTSPFLKVAGDGGVTVGTVSTDEGLGTINAQGLYINGVAVTGTAITSSFSPTFTGFSSPPTCTINWSLSGDIVSLVVQGGGCLNSSSGTGMTLTNLPLAVTPHTAQVVVSDGYQDNTVNSLQGGAVVNTNSTILFGTYQTNLVTNHIEFNSAGFTGSGTKGLGSSWQITYSKGN